MGRTALPLKPDWRLAVLWLPVWWVACGALAANPQVELTTSAGRIVVELYPGKAPQSVANFLSIVDAGGYDGLLFHRVIPGFMVQTGSVRPDLSEITETTSVMNEADNGLRNLEGTVALARGEDIDSAGREFFINVSENPHLDHSESSCTRDDELSRQKAAARGLVKPVTCATFGYTVFGRVIRGMEVVFDIEISETETTDSHEDIPVVPVLLESVRRISPISNDPQ